jgi:hypothetical protein
MWTAMWCFHHCTTNVRSSPGRRSTGCRLLPPPPQRAEILVSVPAEVAGINRIQVSQVAVAMF